MKTTDWFPADIKPVHVGVYETKSPVFNQPGRFSFWSGKKWSAAFFDRFAARNHADISTRFQERKWRGLAEKPE